MATPAEFIDRTLQAEGSEVRGACPLLDRLEEPDATRARRIIDRWSESDDSNLRRAAGLLRV